MLTRERVLLYGSIVPLCFAVMMVVTALSTAGFGRDFWQFFWSASLAAAGKSEMAYVQLGNQTIDQVFPYPPVMMLLCRPLASLSYYHAMAIWYIPGLLLFTFMLSRYVDWKLAVLAALFAPAASINLHLQQNGYYTAILLGGGLLLVERRPIIAGFLSGLLCYKPQFAILLVPALIAGSHWRVVGAAATTSLGLISASAFLYGPAIWLDFIHRSVLQSQWAATYAPAWSLMATVFAMMRLAGATPPIAFICQGISMLAAVAAIIVLWRQKCSLTIKAAGVFIASFLATPYAWEYDAVILTLAAAWIASEACKTGWNPWEKVAVAMLLAFPLLALVSARKLDFNFAPIVLWGCLAIVMRRAITTKKDTIRLPDGKLLAPR